MKYLKGKELEALTNAHNYESGDDFTEWGKRQPKSTIHTIHAFDGWEKWDMPVHRVMAAMLYQVADHETNRCNIEKACEAWATLRGVRAACEMDTADLYVLASMASGDYADPKWAQFHYDRYDLEKLPLCYKTAEQRQQLVLHILKPLYDKYAPDMLLDFNEVLPQ